jgi:hypothetical protein
VAQAVQRGVHLVQRHLGDPAVHPGGRPVGGQVGREQPGGQRVQPLERRRQDDVDPADRTCAAVVADHAVRQVQPDQSVGVGGRGEQIDAEQGARLETHRRPEPDQPAGRDVHGV